LLGREASRSQGGRPEAPGSGVHATGEPHKSAEENAMDDDLFWPTVMAVLVLTMVVLAGVW
jgi:hypothetical protein